LILSSEWRTVTTSALIGAGALVIGDGYRAKNAELDGSGLPFARAGNIDGGIDLVDADVLGEAGVQKAGTKVSRSGDSVFTSKGTVGRFALVLPEHPRFVYSPQLCFWRSLDWSVIDPVFLFYWMQGPEATAQFDALKGQTDMADYVSLGDQRRMHITLPPTDEQQRIAGVLRSFEDKAIAERALGARLAEMLRLKFQHEIVARKDDPPEGWEYASLSEIARFVNGRAITKDANGRGRPIIRIRELKGGVDDATPRTDVAVADEHIARFGDLLFAWSGSLGSYRWLGVEAAINQHIFKVLPVDLPLWFVEGWVDAHMPEFIAIAADKATTMGHIQRRHLDEAPVLVPQRTDISRMDDAYSTLDQRRILSEQVAANADRVRRELLPSLVTGRARVSDAYQACAALDERDERLAGGTAP
jgi:type I restriction enzyme S subunit